MPVAFNIFLIFPAKLTFSRKDVAPTNPRGIPYAPFVDKVEDYVSSRAEVDTVMKNFQEMISYVSAGLVSVQELIWLGNTILCKPTCNGE